MPDHYEDGDIRYNDREQRWERLIVHELRPDDWAPVGNEDAARLAPYDGKRTAPDGIVEFHVAGGLPTDWVTEQFFLSGAPITREALDAMAWARLGIEQPRWWPQALPLPGRIIDTDPETGRPIRSEWDFDSVEYARIRNQYEQSEPERYSTEQVFDGEQAEAYGAKPGGKAIVTFNPDQTVENVQLIEPTWETIDDQINAAFTAGDYNRAAQLEAYRRAVFADRRAM